MILVNFFQICSFVSKRPSSLLPETDNQVQMITILLSHAIGLLCSTELQYMSNMSKVKSRPQQIQFQGNLRHGKVLVYMLWSTTICEQHKQVKKPANPISGQRAS